MWPFNRPAQRRQHDLLTEDVGLARFAPFSEAERYVLVFPVSVGLNYVLVVVYRASAGQSIHVAHSPGRARGGGMWNFVEWIGTGVRRRDPDVVALLTSWPPDTGGDHDLITRTCFLPLSSGRSSPGITVLADREGGVQNVLKRDQECLYSSASFSPKLTAAQWSEIFGCRVRQFTTSEWQVAADDVDPARAVRDAADRETEQRRAVDKAFLKEMGVWDN